MSNMNPDALKNVPEDAPEDESDNEFVDTSRYVSDNEFVDPSRYASEDAPDNVSEDTSRYASEDEFVDTSRYASDNEAVVYDPDRIDYKSLAAYLTKIKSEQHWGIYLQPYFNFIHSVIWGKISFDQMSQLASPSFVIYLLSSNPALANFLKYLMFAIYKCNECGNDWYRFDDEYNEFYVSIFLGFYYEDNSYYVPPRVENIGYLGSVYFYSKWLKYYTIGSRLPLLMFNAIVSKRHAQSFKTGVYQSRILLFLVNFPNKLGVRRVFSFIGNNDADK